jgi:hypothetical protein
MILAAYDVRDAEVDVVDDARQQVQPASVLAADHRVGQQLRIEPLRPADEVDPFDGAAVI